MKLNTLLFRFYIIDIIWEQGEKNKTKKGELEHWNTLANEAFTANYPAILSLLPGSIKYLDILWENMSNTW